jgi:hypothetical protein
MLVDNKPEWWFSGIYGHQEDMDEVLSYRSYAMSMTVVPVA